MKFIIPCLFLALLFSCDPKEEPEVEPTDSYKSIDVVTGMDFFDANGSPIGRWGFPNHYPGEVFVYPIPSLGVISISSQQKIKRIWLTPAECFKDSVTQNITTLSKDLTYEISELENVQVKDISTPDFSDAVNLNFEDVATGFYKLFYQLEPGDLHWYNVYIDPTVNNIPDLSFMDNGCD